MGPALTTPELVGMAADRWPAAEALVDGRIRLTFRQLHEAVDRSTGAALAAGVEPGDRVAIWAPNSWEWVVAALGVHGAGGIIVPMTTRYKGGEAASILASAGARLLFTVPEFLGVDYPSLLDGHETPVERMVLFGSESWDDYLSDRSDRSPPAVAGDYFSDIIFTSGTTGRPKGVLATHAQTVRVVDAWRAAVGLQAGDRYLLVSPFSHASGYKAGFLGAITAGATIYPLAVADLTEMLRLIARERISMLPGTPSLFQSILNHPERARYDLSSLRLSAVGAAPVPVELVERMRSELFDTVVTGYGLTETMGVATMSHHDDPPEVISRTVGRHLPGVEIRVIDAAGKEVPAGVAGEVLIRGFNVMQGYYDAPEATAEAIDPDGWLHTGDVGVLDGDGYLAITDRIKDMFIVGGFNAYPAEIEAALLRHPGVAMAAVIGIPDERLGEVGMAFVVPKPEASLDEAAIVEWARQEMANYKVPRRVAVVDALPLNSVGKIQKTELRTAAGLQDGRR